MKKDSKKTKVIPKKSQVQNNQNKIKLAKKELKDEEEKKVKEEDSKMMSEVKYTEISLMKTNYNNKGGLPQKYSSRFVSPQLEKFTSGKRTNSMYCEVQKSWFHYNSKI